MRILAAALAATLGLSGCAFHGLYSANLPGGPSVGSHPYDVLIDFANVLDLVPQSNVKVNDVAVGKVISVKLIDWHAQVKVKVNGKVDLPENAHASVKMTSLLGEKFVDLEQPPAGTASTTRLHNGSHIPLSATGTAPEVEEVLGAIYLVLNGGGLQQIQTITNELNKALSGNESAVRDLLTQLNTFVGRLDAQKTEITDALVKINRLAVTLNKNKKSITDALDTFPQALSILSKDRSKLTSLLDSLAHLGTTATDILLTKPNGDNQTVQQLFVDSLQQLQPPLEQLAAAGSDFPKALQILLTFPFPLGKATEFLRTDYANLGLHLNFSLNDNLCGLNIPGLCDLINALSPQKTTAIPDASTQHTTKAATSQPISLPGVDG
jgi:phospholipid/cholesterol/gamma-HCH transport system substrate-binding protein